MEIGGAGKVVAGEGRAIELSRFLVFAACVCCFGIQRVQEGGIVSAGAGDGGLLV